MSFCPPDYYGPEFYRKRVRTSECYVTVYTQYGPIKVLYVIEEDSQQEIARRFPPPPFEKIEFPAINSFLSNSTTPKRIFPTLFSSEICSVQPMTIPTGAIFFLDFMYGDKK